MKLNIIKHQNGNEVMNFILNLDTLKEIMSVIDKVSTYTDKKKGEILSAGLPYEEIKEGNFKGFISPSFQVITSGNHIDITDGDTNYQLHFFSSLEVMSLPILAA